ncbi:hypothetical protein [Aestuariivivens sediminicola]|uniref:hypothetical protein n=1 Tax=Aestuariivivens sediminicola TaxID=2913560 RepID=UPI001F59E997|nr:hypothetical protein [Aestuariivivens sediminicola]
MKTLQSLLVVVLLLLSFNAKADDMILNTDLNLFNPDVRKCLIESSKEDGWELKSVYLNTKNEIIMIFDRGDETKIYKSK